MGILPQKGFCIGRKSTTEIFPRVICETAAQRQADSRNVWRGWTEVISHFHVEFRGLIAGCVGRCRMTVPCESGPGGSKNGLFRAIHQKTDYGEVLEERRDDAGTVPQGRGGDEIVDQVIFRTGDRKSADRGSQVCIETGAFIP